MISWPEAAIAVMLIVTATQAAGAIWARQDYRNIKTVAEAVTPDYGFDADERRLASALLGPFLAWYTTPLLVIVIPLFALFLTGKAIWLPLTGRPLTIFNLLGPHVKSSSLWNMINAATWKSRPLLIVWGALWAIPPLFIISALMGSGKIIPEAIRRASETILSKTAHP